MPERDTQLWPPARDDTPDGADSIAGQLASRIDAVPAAPGDAMDWAAVAAGFLREAEALGQRPEAAPLLFEAGRIHDERLGDGAGALELHRRAFALDRTLLPNLRACRRLALDRADDALAADVLAAEASATEDAVARADLLLLRGRLLATLGRTSESNDVLAAAAAAAPQGFAAAEEAARAAAASGDRAALAEAYVLCARAAADRRLSAHYLSAAAALLEEALGRADRAAALALDAFALLPEDPLLRDAARRHAERLGRTDALAEILRADAAATAGAPAADAWQALAHLEERLGHPEAAIAALERARAAAPDEPLALAELARLREALGAFADASDALEALAVAHVVKRGPGHVQEAVAAKLRRVEIEEAELGRLHAAVDCCHDVLELDPGNRAALSALGRLCARLGDWEGLIAAFDAEGEAARDPREQAQRRFKAAAVLEERLGRVDDAIARYREALSLDPDLIPARSALERLCESEGRWEDLCAMLQGDLAEMRSPAEQVAHLFRIARIREDRIGDLAGAAELYRRILDLDPASRLAIPALEAVLARAGRFDELAAVLASEAALADGQKRKLGILQRRAELLEEHVDDDERARAAWEDVRAVAPTHLPALRALGRLHARADRWQELAAMFRAEADATTDTAAAAALVQRRGEILERHLGRSDDAIGAYREALMLAPSHLPALDALARLYRARGDDESLVEILRAQAAARTSPRERGAALAEAARISEERLRDRERAIESYEDALRVAPGFPAAVRALDRLYAQSGRGDALAALRRSAGAEASAEDRAERLLLLARLEADRVGDARAALRAVDELLAAAPGHPAALLLELRLATDPERRARARAGLADAAAEPEPRATLYAAAALETRPASARREGLARASALLPSSAALVPSEQRRLRESGDHAALARFCEARRDESRDRPSRACWAADAGEAWLQAGDEDRALAAFQSSLEDDPASLPALRGARALYVRKGDWAAVRGGLQAEAALLRDAHAAATAWVEAGLIAERRFGDAHAAAADYRRAAERDPLDPAPLQRLEAVLGGSAAPEVAAVHEARARAEHDERRAAESWLAAARAALESGRGDAAAAALDRALEARPDLSAALELRARLHAEAGRFAEALADTEACLALGGEESARVSLHLSAAALREEKVGDPAGALPHLHAALAASPENAEALARLARVQVALGHPADAAASLRRLVDVPGLSPGALVEYLLALAEGDERLGARDDAVSACRRALAIDPGDERALRLLVRLEERGGDPEIHLAALEAAASQARDPDLRAEAHAEAARVLVALRRPGRAVGHLRATLDLDPGQTDARWALTQLLEETSPSEAIDEHRRLVVADPLRPASWIALYRLFERTRAHDRAYVVASILRWLGQAPPGPAAETLLQEGDRQALGIPPALPEEDWDLLRGLDDRGPLADVVRAAGDTIAAAVGEPPERQRAPLRPDHPFRRALAELSRTLPAPEHELYLSRPGRVDVEPGVPYAVLVGTDVARSTTAREQRFLAGRVLARLRSRSCLAHLLPDSALAGWVAAAVRSVVPTYPADAGLVRRIAKVLSRRDRRALEGPAAALASMGSPDMEAWAAAAAATADRTGLVLCGDVPSAVALLLRDGRASQQESGPAAARDRPDVLSLLAFATTDEHFLLRQKLRVAIA